MSSGTSLVQADPDARRALRIHSPAESLCKPIKQGGTSADITAHVSFVVVHRSGIDLFFDRRPPVLSSTVIWSPIPPGGFYGLALSQMNVRFREGNWLARPSDLGRFEAVATRSEVDGGWELVSLPCYSQACSQCLTWGRQELRHEWSDVRPTIRALGSEGSGRSTDSNPAFRRSRLSSSSVQLRPKICDP